MNFRYYGGQKKTLELNPRHPLVKKLKERYDEDSEDETTKDIANMLFETATLRSGFILPDTSSFAERIERMMRLSMDIPLDEPVRLRLEMNSLSLSWESCLRHLLWWVMGLDERM